MQSPLTLLGLGLSALVLPGLLQGSPGAIASPALAALVPAHLAPAQLAQAPAPQSAKLTLSDLPDGFIEPPPAVKTQIVQQLSSLSTQFQRSGVTPQDFYVYIHPQRLEIVMGFQGAVSDPEQFDYYLAQSQQPKQQAQITASIRDRLATMDGIALTQYETLALGDELGDRAAGIQLGLTLQGQPFQTHLVTFRRGGVGLFTAVMYAQRPNLPGPLADVLTLATTLDQRTAARRP